MTLRTALFLVSLLVKSQGLPCSSCVHKSNAQPAFSPILAAAVVTLGTEHLDPWLFPVGPLLYNLHKNCLHAAPILSNLTSRYP